MKKLLNFNIYVLCLFGIVLLLSCSGNGNKREKKPKVSKNEPCFSKELVHISVKEIADLFEYNYVFEDMGLQISESLNNHLVNGRYDKLPNYDSLCKLIEFDIQAICKDKHARVAYNGSCDIDTVQQKVSLGNFFEQFDDFGFSEVKMLEGNIGYLKLDIFYPTRLNGEAIKVANQSLESLSDAKYLIFDLRENRGGDPSMLNLIVSHLFPADSSIHLNSMYFRQSNDTVNFYTESEIQPLFQSIPVAVLTSNRTFSCAEEFAYDLKYLKRARIIGEATGGGANPVRPFNVSNDIEVSVPIGVAINPITKSNWEGTGVKPDIEVSREAALDTALELFK